MRFKAFLTEAGVGQDPAAESASVETAIALLNKHCKNALWMLEQDRPIYRGEKNVKVLSKVSATGFAIIDTSATARQSENTSNYYTVLLDKLLPSEFPLRSRSFIASTSKQYAADFAHHEYKDIVMVMVPFDSTKIGLVNQDDMWNTKFKLFRPYAERINEHNADFKRLGIEPNWESFVDFDRRLAAGDPDAERKFRLTYPNIKSSVDVTKIGFLDKIESAYSASKLGFSAETTATMPNNKSTEVWVGGKTMLVTLDMWDAMRKQLQLTASGG